MTDNNDNDEILLFDESSDVNEKKFAELIGYIEDILVDENFVKTLEEFFKNSIENRNVDVDLDLFGNYVTTVKRHVEEQLKKKVKCFEMAVFEEELGRKESEIGTDIFEILSSFRNFQAFKQFVQDYREGREMSGGISGHAVLVSQYRC